jgi:hypothetical protein
LQERSTVGVVRVDPFVVVLDRVEHLGEVADCESVPRMWPIFGL